METAQQQDDWVAAHLSDMQPTKVYELHNTRGNPNSHFENLIISLPLSLSLSTHTHPYAHTHTHTLTHTHTHTHTHTLTVVCLSSGYPYALEAPAHDVFSGKRVLVPLKNQLFSLSL